MEILKKNVPVFTNTGYYKGFPVVIKVILLLIWGMLSFILSNKYLDAKFIGIFYRLDSLFKSMISDDSLTLAFRKEDDFFYMAESFNKMRKMFMDRITRRSILLKDLQEKIEKMPFEASQNSVEQMIQEIDSELNR